MHRSKDIVIRQERKQDYEEVCQLIKEAFSGAEHADGDEQDLVVRLRNSDEFITELSLVAEVDGIIAGHILFTKIIIGDRTELALAPVSVRPDMQSKGIGSKLINEGHRVAEQLGYKAVILVGHADYYPRFGYEPAGVYGLEVPFDVPEENFMVKFLSTGDQVGLSGMVTYSPAFFGE